MYITVVGGGNSTPIFAALAADAGHTVAILTRKPEAWDKDDIGFTNEDLGWYPQPELRTKVALITSDPAQCIPQSDLIFIAGLPIHHNPKVLRSIRPHMDMTKKVRAAAARQPATICTHACNHLQPRLHPCAPTLAAARVQVFVGSICAYGGFNWVAAEALGPGACPGMLNMVAARPNRATGWMHWTAALPLERRSGATSRVAHCARRGAEPVPQWSFRAASVQPALSSHSPAASIQRRPGQRPCAAPVPPRDAPSGSGRLDTPQDLRSPRAALERP